MKMHIVLCILFLHIHISLSSVFDFITPIISPFLEQCDSRWVPSNIAGLRKDLHENIFGQDLAVRVVLTALQSHLVARNRKKPLVLSFHGWTGGGKTFVKDFIVKHWFYNGHSSKFIKTYFAERDFPRNDEKLVYEYKERIHKELEETIRLCPWSIFVFDEVDKYPPYVLDAIKPYIDYNTNVNGYDYRKAIFILITNSGGRLLTQVALQKWQNGEHREDFRLMDFEEPLRTFSFNDEGGFYRSDLIKHHLIDYIIPFLPLERAHVQSCIMAVIKEKGSMSRQVFDQIVREILEEITYEPKDTRLYASQGCHNIESKVNLKFEEFQGLENWKERRKNEL